MKNYWILVANCLLMTCAAANSLHAAEPALKRVFKKDFLIGAAINETQFSDTSGTNREVTLIQQQFDSITPENVLKWESIHPAPHFYNFAVGDRYVNFGVKNHMFIIGHNLVWHNQTPDWVFRDEHGALLTRDALLQRMHDHIFAVVGRYKGKIKGWDVVNEALEEDGSLRQSQWMKIIGEDYLLKAYQFAHEADPKAELYYNDYSLENPPKCAGAVALIKKLQAQGVKIAGVGMQGHYIMDWPSPEQVETTINALAALGVKVMITELDIDVLPRPSNSHSADVTLNFKLRAQENPYTAGLPDGVQQALAARYSELFKVFVKHREQVSRVTFWGVTDGDSWLNSFPVHGRTNYPLLFDRDCMPKPAFYAITK